MSYYLPQLENYYDLKKELALRWGLGEASFELFPTPYHALFEVTLGLQQIFSTRKVCLFQRSFHPYVEELAVRFSRLGFRVEWVDILGEELEALKEKGREILFLLYSEENPLTGECLPPESLESFEKFPSFPLSLSYLHRGGLPRAQALGRSQARFHVLEDGRTLSFLGGRVQVPLTLSPHLSGDFLSLDSWSQRPGSVEDESLVKAFEKFAQDRWGAKPVSCSLPRQFDRALVDFVGLDSSALRDQLIEIDLRYDLLKPFALNYHRSTKAIQWLLSAEVDVESLQGRLMVPLRLIDERLRQDIGEALQKVKSYQEMNF